MKLRSGLWWGIVAWSLAGCHLLDLPGTVVDSELGPAEEISSGGLDRLSESGDVFAVQTRTVEEEASARASRVADAEVVIDDFLTDHPELAGTLRQTLPADAELRGPNVVHTLADGQEVLLQGDAWDRLTVAGVIERMQDADHQADILEEMLLLVPPACRDLAPPAASWPTLDADALIAARVAVIHCWQDWRGATPVADLAPAPAKGQDDRSEWSEPSDSCDPEAADTDGPGQGNDGYRATLPTLPALQSWALLDKLPAVRSQASRGTCVAFATASAIEHVYRLRLGTTVDVSEQYLYSLGKHDFYDEHYDDGLPGFEFLSDLADRGSPISIEDGWGYNPSRCREDHDGLERYRDSCVGYGNPACGESTHQMKPYVSGGELHLYRPRSEATVQVRHARELTLYGLYWETLAHAELFLSDGYAVVATLRWPDNGWEISTKDGIATAPADEEKGGHAVHLIGWMRDANYAGGGLVVIKNSWGSRWGDQGYAYLPLADFGAALKSLTVIDVASRENTPPRVRIQGDGGSWPKGTSFTLEAVVTDDEQGSDCCTVEWSDKGALLGTGSTLTLSPSRVGRHRITATVRDAYGALDQSTAEVEVYQNQAPRIAITRPRVPAGQDWVSVPLGARIAFSGTASDPDQFLACDQQRWTIDGNGTVHGCTRTRALTEPGIYTVTFEAEDDGGLVASDQIRLVVREWTEFDDPFLMITWPRAGTLHRYDDTVTTNVETVPTQAGTVAWTLVSQFHTATWTTSGNDDRWVPDDLVTVPNAWSDATLRAEWTADGATVWDEIPLTLLGRPN